MADVTYYVALPFGIGDNGPEPREAVECTSASAAIVRAERWQRTHPEDGVNAAARALKISKDSAHRAKSLFTEGGQERGV
jgi:hypothetical protein